MERLGDKAQAKAEMRAAGVPLVPGHRGHGARSRRSGSRPREIGFPVLLKAAAGGGGKGMRLVTAPDELDAAYGAAAARGRGGVRATAPSTSRRPSAPARHVEIQVLCDHHGGVLTLGERECSIQRRHQKLVEESPSPALTPETREAMEAAVERACRRVGYANAGTFEFILGPDGDPYFIEVNCRLQVEHPVSELVTGIDIVREQLRIAAGEPLVATGRAPRRGPCDRDPHQRRGPGARLPAGARPRRAVPVPLGPGVRVDTAIADGAVIPPFYDSMIAKLIVHDADRPAAIARAVRALGELEIVGIPTTRDVAIDVLLSEGFASGAYSTGYLDEMADSLPSLRPA